jgi:hypothetical protein
MTNRPCGALSALCALAITGVGATSASAQTADAKEKPPLYTYVSTWAIPRAHWADMSKQEAATQKIFDKAVAGGTLVGYGVDENLIHQPDGETHDSFWSATSMAGVLSVLDDLHNAGASTVTVLGTATRHSDSLYVSHFYNWKAGSVKGGYTHGASYKLKADAPNDAVENLSNAFIVPLLEKLLADGTVVEYEVDEEAIHTEAPGTFWIFYVTANAQGIDKVNAALRAALKGNSLAGPAFDSVVDFAPHRDFLARTDATYK